MKMTKNKNTKGLFGRFKTAKNTPNTFDEPIKPSENFENSDLDIDVLSELSFDDDPHIKVNEPTIKLNEPPEFDPSAAATQNKPIKKKKAFKNALTKKSKKDRPTSIPLLVLVGLLILALTAYLLYELLMPKETEQTVVEPTPVVQPATSDATPAAEVAPVPTTDAATAQDVTFDPESIPDPEEIINAEIPQSESLAKEEIDKLEDEYLRLSEQEQIGKQQAELMADLTQKKEEQIALLERQIAQLEAQKKAPAQPTTDAPVATGTETISPETTGTQTNDTGATTKVNAEPKPATVQ